MNRKTIITALLALVAMAGQAQTKVIGHVVNERGDGVEYVSILITSIQLRGIRTWRRSTASAMTMQTA